MAILSKFCSTLGQAADCLKCNAIHKTIVEHFRVAIVYGKSVKHQPQRVGLSHELKDEDISTYSLYQKQPLFLGCSC